MSSIQLQHGSVVATFEPRAGMIATSLTDDGVELLGQGRGLAAYVDTGELFGLPILHPWANRLAEFGYTAQGRTVALSAGQQGVCLDENGLVIHGLLAAYPGWHVEQPTAEEVLSRLDFGADPALLAGFPFPHEVSMRIALRRRTLTVRTTVTATSQTPVPLCIGFHPYLVIPEVPRPQWVVEMPAMRHLELDDHFLPTGRSSSQPAGVARLGDTVYDDGYDQVAEGAVFALSGGGRRIEVCFESGYPAAQVYAPSTKDVVCFEPMTAPTEALRRGGYRSVQPGESVDLVFSIRV